MNSKVELWVNGTGQTNQGQIELYPDEPITIQMANSDIKDIKIRKSPFTQSFVVPGNKTTNQIFNNIFNIGSDCYFDPRKKTKAYLLVDSIPVMQNGNLQLTGIVVGEKKNIDYEISIFDDTEDLIDAIGDNYLTDLDFSELNHVWNYTNITNSWTGTTFNNRLFYPLIDYGYDFNISDMNVGLGVNPNQLVPATQVKYIWDKIFSAANFTYDSSFLSGSYFSNLYVPFNSSAILTQDSGFTISRSFQAQASGNTAVTINLGATSFFGTPYGVYIPYDLPFTDDSTGPNFDNGNLYIASSHTYSSDTFSNQIFNVQLNYQLDVTGSTVINGIRNFVRFYRSSYMGGNLNFPYYTASDWPGTNVVNAPVTSTYASAALNDPSSPTLYPAQPGETFFVRTFFNFTYSTTGESVTFNWLSAGTYFFNTVGTDAFPGQTLNYNNFIPKKIKQIDFVNSIISMHNLYVTPSKINLKTLRIEPRDVYYSGGTTKIWTKKLDANVKVKEQLISEQQNKRIIFTYKKDEDYYNSDYSLNTNKIFGDLYFDIDNDFVKDDKKIEVIFSPTPSVAVLQSSTSTTNYANEFVIPKIGKRDSSNNFGKTDSNIRILQRNVAGVINLDSSDYWKLSGVTQTKYPYLGMLDHPSTGTTDIAFGEVDYEYYTLSSITRNNLVNQYWRQYLEQISDKDSKLITANFYLTPSDIQQFDFSDSIFVEGLTDDGGHYFIVNSIEYSPTSNKSSKVELIKVKNKHVDKVSRGNIISTAVRDTFQSISRGGGTSVGVGSVAIGPAVYVSAGANRSFAMGEDLTIGEGANRSFIMGSGSTVYPGTQGAVVFGDNVSASTSNTVYVPNIIIASGGTINGTVFSALTASTFLWSSGTGSNSIIANNGTGNIANGTFSIAAGYTTQASGLTSLAFGQANIAYGNKSNILGGRNNKAYGYYTFIGNGTVNRASGYNSTVVNGNGNNSSSYYSAIVNGQSNIASYSKTLIGNGYGNSAITSSYATVVNGKNNLASGVSSFIGNGNNNIASAIKSLIGNGALNSATTGYYSTVVNGKQNRASGAYSTILNGSGNTVTGAYSAIIGGQSILGSANNTVYVPNLVVTGNLTATGGTNLVLAKGRITADYSNTGGPNILKLSSATIDTSSSYSAVSSTFIVPVDGYYQIDANIQIESTSGPVTHFGYISLYSGAVPTNVSILSTNSANEFNTLVLSDIVYGNQGAYLTLQITTDSIFNIKGASGTVDFSWWTIKKL